MDIKRMMGGALRNAPLTGTQAPPREPWDEQPMPRQRGPFELGGVGQMGGGMPDQQMPGKKPGFGDILSDFVINYGAASGNPLATGILEQRLAQQQAAAQQAAQERMYERKRGDERADKQWEWQNKPKDPYRWKANDGSPMEIGPDGQPRVIYKDPTPKMEVQWITNPDGTRTLIQVPVGGASAPSAPVTMDDWNSAKPMTGGAGSNASGGFR